MSSTSPSSSSTPAHILVVDDEPDLRTLYELTLLREGYRVDAAGTVAEAWQQLQARQFDAVITDMRLPDGQGLELLQRLQQDQRSERCVVITAYGSAENAVEALKAGAFDYLTKPVDLKQFRSVVASALQVRASAPMQQHASAMGATGAGAGAGASAVAATTTTTAGATGTSDAPARPAVPPGGLTVQAAMMATSVPPPYETDASINTPQALVRLVGESQPMRQVKARIVKVARSMAPVLVHGESGTGKELVARAIHDCSQRSEGPFVAVNCGAIPENLLEAEFFGARKGSYTGSAQDRDGFFQAAQDGTLFLDEIGDLPLAMQSKLLRAIQERRVRPIGSTQEDPVDVRIVSATHKDLQAEVQAGRFRQDLYYRLNVIEIVLPALRERREDLPALCRALLARIGQDSGIPVPRLSQQALDALVNLPLHGNVRELENLLHRAVALSEGDELQLDTPFASESGAALAGGASEGGPGTDAQALAIREARQAMHPTLIPAPPRVESAGIPQDLQEYLDQKEREILVRALQETGFNRTAAAARLGLSLRQMRYRIARLGIGGPHDDEA